MTTQPDPGSVVITLKDVWMEMSKLRDDVRRMDTNAAVLTDHETRIRATERWRYALPASVLMAASSAGLTIAEMIVKK